MGWTARHLQEVLGLAVRVTELWAVHGRPVVEVRPLVPVELMLDFVMGRGRRLVVAVVLESRRKLAAGEVDVPCLAEPTSDVRQR